MFDDKFYIDYVNVAIPRLFYSCKGVAYEIKNVLGFKEVGATLYARVDHNGKVYTIKLWTKVDHDGWRVVHDR